MTGAALIPSRNAKQWTAVIKDAHARSLTAVLETGRRLAEAKADLPHGEYQAMIESDLPFAAATARKLVIVAADVRLTDRARVHALPPSWGTLYELTKLDDQTLKARFDDGTVRVDMQRRDIALVVQKQSRDRRELELGKKILALPNQVFGVVVTDDEWDQEAWSDAGLEKSAVNKYPVSSLDELKARDVGALGADDSIIFMWCTAPHLAQAIELMVHRGYTYKTNVVWKKRYVGQPHGTGRWFWIIHEHLLLGTRGKVPAPTPGTQWDSVIEEMVGEHSAKPEIFHELIEEYFPNVPKIELNRRGVPRDGWCGWGNETEGDHERDIAIDENGFADASHLPHPAPVVRLLDAPIASPIDMDASLETLSPEVGEQPEPPEQTQWQFWQALFKPEDRVSKANEKTDAVMTAGYAEDISPDVIGELLGWTSQQVRSRASYIGLGDRKRTARAVRKTNRARGKNSQPEKENENG